MRQNRETRDAQEKKTGLGRCDRQNSHRPDIFCFVLASPNFPKKKLQFETLYDIFILIQFKD